LGTQGKGGGDHSFSIHRRRELFPLRRSIDHKKKKKKKGWLAIEGKKKERCD